MRHIQPPSNLYPDGSPVLFLAGSIEMGAAEKWQDKVIDALKDKYVTIMNPRRNDWDSSWVQLKHNPQFRGQVEWEQKGLRYATVVCFYFDPKTLSPVTLLELGQRLENNSHQHLVVCCPDGYFRKGNVDIVCENRRYLTQVDTLDEMISFLGDIFEDE